uniref:Uncharacterized protein n=1 Tax=Trichobilharzia regenti TaxID=157069 RepID=A0AA85J8T2_TRIRE|nr:unnamed protein product [Trichobilharzia regenti]
MLWKLYIISIYLYAFISICADDNVDNVNHDEGVITVSKYTGNLSEERLKAMNDRITDLIKEEFAKEEQEVKEMLEEAKKELKEAQAKSRNSASHYGSDLVLLGISVVMVTLTCVCGILISD